MRERPYSEDVTAQVKSSGHERLCKESRPHTGEAFALGKALAQKYDLPGPLASELEDKTGLLSCDDGQSTPRPLGFVLKLGFWNQTGYDAPWEL